MIIINEVSSKKEWESFIKKHPEANFLSSWNWGEFHTALKKKVYYRGFYDQDDTLIGVCLLVKEEAKRGNYLTCAGGPIFEWSNADLVEAWVNDIRKLAQTENCLFVRVRPQIEETSKNKEIFKDRGFVSAPMHLTADLTLQLDLHKSEDQLMKEMRKSTRYEVRKSKKLNLKVKKVKDPKIIDEFHQHQLALAEKHGFVPFGLEFLKKQFQVFVEDDQVVLFRVFKEEELLASAFVIMYGEEAVYHYGISTDANRRLPGSYAGQWAAIKEAKSRGLSRYNFWGIAPEDAPKDHRFAGVSLFKRGFGGEEVAYLPAQDLPISPMYWLVYAFEWFRAKRRNLS